MNEKITPQGDEHKKDRRSKRRSGEIARKVLYMSNSIRIFENNQFGQVRTLTINDQPFFVGKDVAEILGYTNTRKALIDHVDEYDKGVTKCDTLGGMQDMTIINESGLYSLILSSKLPTARKFKHWVTSEVLPSIRRSGGYIHATSDETPEQIMAKADFMSINVGDTVKLIDKFYEHEAFRSDIGWIRKQIASLKNTQFIVKDIYLSTNRAVTGKIDYTVPVELLEKVEELPAKTISDEIEDLIEAFAEVVKPVVEMITEFVKRLVEVYGVDLVEISKRIDQGMSFQEAIESISKHRYTDEQIAEAERIMGEIVADMAWRHQITFALVDGNIIALSWRDRYENTKKVFEAKCSPHDEYNETIGKMICLCRAAGKKLPDWIWK